MEEGRVKEELKNLGYRISVISVAFSTFMVCFIAFQTSKIGTLSSAAISVFLAFLVTISAILIKKVRNF